MKKPYTTPLIRVGHINQQDIICTSPYGPNSESIPFEGEEGDEQIYRPSHDRGMWDEW